SPPQAPRRAGRASSPPMANAMPPAPRFVRDIEPVMSRKAREVHDDLAGSLWPTAGFSASCSPFSSPEDSLRGRAELDFMRRAKFRAKRNAPAAALATSDSPAPESGARHAARQLREQPR